VPRARQTAWIRCVAVPSGASGGAPSARSLTAPETVGLGAKLKQLAAPFSDPQANSKMLSLAAGEACVTYGSLLVASNPAILIV
jgi:hypothetical protein